jgi:hypothetical protein
VCFHRFVAIVFLSSNAVGTMPALNSFDEETDMLGQIIAKTPLWVWALLAFLIYRGVSASVDREVRLGSIFAIPLVMLALSIQGIASSFGASPIAALSWLACVVAAAMLTWRFSGGAGITAYPPRRMILQHGSWMLLILMMGIFITKYAVAVTLAIHPGYRQDGAFVAAVCALYGGFNGIFIGKLLRVISVYRRAAAGLDLSPTESFSRSTGQKF